MNRRQSILRRLHAVCREIQGYKELSQVQTEASIKMFAAAYRLEGKRDNLVKDLHEEVGNHHVFSLITEHFENQGYNLHLQGLIY